MTGDDWAIIGGGIFFAVMLFMAAFGPTNPYD